MGRQKYIYDKNGSVKAVIYEDDYTSTVVVPGEGAIGTVFKGHDGIPDMAYTDGITGFADDSDTAAGMVLSDWERKKKRK